MVRCTKKKLVVKYNLKIVRGEGPISCTWYQKKLAGNSNQRIVSGEGPIFGT